MCARAPPAAPVLDAAAAELCADMPRWCATRRRSRWCTAWSDDRIPGGRRAGGHGCARSGGRLLPRAEGRLRGPCLRCATSSSGWSCCSRVRLCGPAATRRARSATCGAHGWTTAQCRCGRRPRRLHPAARLMEGRGGAPVFVLGQGGAAGAAAAAAAARRAPPPATAQRRTRQQFSLPWLRRQVEGAAEEEAKAAEAAAAAESEAGADAVAAAADTGAGVLATRVKFEATAKASRAARPSTSTRWCSSLARSSPRDERRRPAEPQRHRAHARRATCPAADAAAAAGGGGGRRRSL